MCEEEAVIIHVEAQGQPAGLEGVAEKLEMGQKGFTSVKTCPRNHAAVVIQNVQKSRLPILTFKPVMR